MKHYLSEEKYKELSEELKQLTTEGRKKMGERLDVAKSFGDLKENAEYHQAREDQGKMEARIKEIEAILNEAEILKDKKREVVEIGAEVTLQKKSCKEKQVFIIVDSSETDLATGKISLETPLVQAMLGKKEGEVFDFLSPSGAKINYKIISIK